MLFSNIRTFLSFYRAFSNYKWRTNSAWDTMCDDDKVYPALMSFFGNEESDFVGSVVAFLMKWDKLFDEYELPNCGGRELQ